MPWSHHVQNAPLKRRELQEGRFGPGLDRVTSSTSFWTWAGPSWCVGDRTFTSIWTWSFGGGPASRAGLMRSWDVFVARQHADALMQRGFGCRSTRAVAAAAARREEVFMAQRVSGMSRSNTENLALFSSTIESNRLARSAFCERFSNVSARFIGRLGGSEFRAQGHRWQITLLPH